MKTSVAFVRSLFGSRGSLQRNVLYLGLVSFFTDVSSEMIYPMLPVLLAAITPAGQAALFIGIMDGVAETTSALVKIAAGRWSDRIHRRKMPTFFGYALSAMARPLMALAATGWQVVALRFFDRTGKGIRTPSRDAMIRESVDAAHRGLAFSFHRAMDHTGAVLGPLLAIALLALMGEHDLFVLHPTAPTHSGSLTWLFAIAAVPGFLSLVAFLPVRETARGENPQPVQKTMHRPLPRRFFVFLAAVVLFTLGNSSDLFLVYLARERFGASSGVILLLWVLLHLAKIAFSLPGGGLSDRLGRRPLIFGGWVLYALVYLGFAFAGSFLAYVALLIAYGLYYGATEGAEKALVADFVPAAQSGTAFGLYHAAVGLAALPASALFGLLWTLFGAGVAFATGAGLALLASLLLLWPVGPKSVGEGHPQSLA